MGFGLQLYLLGLLDARGPPADLPGGLVEPALDVALPVLVEVRIRHHLVPFRRHLGGLGGPVWDETISLYTYVWPCPHSEITRHQRDMRSQIRK